MPWGGGALHCMIRIALTQWLRREPTYTLVHTGHKNLHHCIKCLNHTTRDRIPCTSSFAALLEMLLIGAAAAGVQVAKSVQVVAATPHCRTVSDLHHQHLTAQRGSHGPDIVPAAQSQSAAKGCPGMSRYMVTRLRLIWLPRGLPMTYNAGRCTASGADPHRRWGGGSLESLPSCFVSTHPHDRQWH